MHFPLRLAMVFLLALFAAIPLSANDALQRIPENALGFAVVKNLEQTSAKVDQLLVPLDITFPSPLSLVKIVTGWDAGLDPSGNVVIAFLPADDPKSEPEPLVFVPVSSYEEFANSINADASGEICRITLLGEDILVAQDGPYAMLMNVEYRQTMEELVSLEAEPIASLAPLANWLPNQDVAVVLMPAGLQYVSQIKQQSSRLLALRSSFSRSRSTYSSFLSEVFSPKALAALRSHVNLAAAGVAMDDRSTVRVSEQLILKETSPLAKLAPTTSQSNAAKLGLSPQPFVFTAGGPLEAGWGKQVAILLGATEQETQPLQVLLDDLRSCSMVMLPGEKPEPLLGNFMGVATVPNTQTYLEAIPTVVESWNKLLQAAAGDIKLEIELNPLTVSGQTGYEFVVDIASQADDPRVPTLRWMYEAALGPDGKLRVQLLPVDETTLVFGLATKSQLSELLEIALDDSVSSPTLPDALATLQMLQPTSQWKLLASPQGCVQWASRVASEFLVHISPTEVKIPEIPDSPPVGLSAQWNGQQLQFEAVLPEQTWKNLARYYQATK